MRGLCCNLLLLVAETNGTISLLLVLFRVEVKNYFAFAYFPFLRQDFVQFCNKTC